MMKTFKMILLVTVVLAAAFSVSAEKKGEKTVVFNVTMDCGSCKAKVEKNIPYEKGVKKMSINMDAQTVAITYKEGKNTEENLQKAIEKLGLAVNGTKASSSDKKACADNKDCKKACCKDKKACADKKDCKKSCCKDKKESADKK